MPQMPAWADRVIQHREHFQDCVFAIHVGMGECSWYKFIYAVKTLGQLYLAINLLELDRNDNTDTAENADPMDQAPPVLYTWRCNYANHLNASGVPPCSMSQVFVIPHCSHIGGVLLVSRCDPIPLARFLSQLPGPEPAAKKARKAGNSGDHKDEAIKEFPWLEHLDFQEGFENR